MIVVSDTSPLNYLPLIDAAELLPELYRQVYAPPRVIEELQEPGAPALVSRWAKSLPSWLLVRAPSIVDPTLKLHPGEAQAITLALELQADRLLIDERRGRDIARDLGIQVIGLLGVFDEAADRKLIDMEQTLHRLHQTSFRIDPQLVQFLLERDARRKQAGQR